MAINKQIKIARGSHTSIANITSDKLVAWEPIYDKDRKYLYIWNGEGEPSKNLNPIITNKIIGYIDDDIGSSKYEFNADSTGAYIKSNTLQFDVKDIRNNNILSATNSNLIFKGDLKSGYNTIYTYSNDSLTVTDISSRAGGTLSNFGIVTGNRDIWTGSGTISTSTSITTPEISGVNNTLSIDATSGVNFNGSITTPEISGVNNTLSIDATSGVNFNGKITSNDLLINLRADINQINANELAISKTSGIGISCYDSAIATKEIQASSTNILNINASAGVIFNGDITASGKNITAAKFIGNLTGNVTGYAGQVSTVFTTCSATFTLTDGTSTKNIVFIY